MLVPTFSSFTTIQTTFQKNFNWIFKFGCLSDAELNPESIDTNFKSQKWKSKNLVCPFLIVLFYFETNLIKIFPFFQTILDNWEISSKSVSIRKIS